MKACPMTRAYRRWCKDTFPDYKVTDFPLRGRMFEVWCAAWRAGSRHAVETVKGESK